MKQVNNKKIIIFGGSGSLGTALIRRLLEQNKLLIFSRDEAKHWTIKNMYQSSNLSFMVGDIRDKDRVRQALVRFKPEIVIIAAALKQVVTCELSPKESIDTNILGINNIVDVAEEEICSEFLETVLMVSTDKACAPINVYGMCKAISERLVLEKARHATSPKFVAVRYGNVLESRGSIVPLFKYQSENAAEITLTRKDMTRFLMTLDDSVDLISTTILRGESGETWIPKLPSMCIEDLANIFAEISGKPVKEIGIRTGEKIHELLVNKTESLRVVELDRYYVIKPATKNKVYNERVFEYSSEDSVLSKQDLLQYLKKCGIFNNFYSPSKTIEEIRKAHPDEIYDMSE